MVEANLLRVNAAELTTLLQEAGFESALAWWLVFATEASSFGNFVGHLPEPLRAQAREEIRRELETIKTPRGIHQEGGRLLAVAVKPR